MDLKLEDQVRCFPELLAIGGKRNSVPESLKRRDVLLVVCCLKFLENLYDGLFIGCSLRLLAFLLFRQMLSGNRLSTGPVQFGQSSARLLDV